MSTVPSGAGRQWRPRLRWVTPARSDVALAAVAWGLDTLALNVVVVGPAVFVCSAVGFAALAWRRVAPVGVFVTVWLQSLVGSLLIDGYRPVLGLLIALYTVATLRDARTAVLALAASYGSMTPVAIREEWEQNPDDSRIEVAGFILLAYAMFNGAAWGVGRWVRSSRTRITDLEVEQERAAAEAVRAERRRIAHELHDIVSHSVSVMVLQASGARRVLATSPARADEALAHIEVVGKQSMSELRRLLGVLDAPPADGATVPDGGTQPGLADLPGLLEGMRMSGLSVRLLEEGVPARLDPSVDLSAYRIVQEALTNTIKHAGREAMATVYLRWSEETLTIDIIDDGGSSATAEDALSTQHGLPGLRERARAVGGSLEAGPTGDRGFRVSASLPLSADSTDTQAPAETP